MDRGVPAGERPQASTASGKCASIPATGTDHGSRMFISRSDLSHRSPMRNDSKSPFAGADCLVGHRPREFFIYGNPPSKARGSWASPREVMPPLQPPHGHRSGVGRTATQACARDRRRLRTMCVGAIAPRTCSSVRRRARLGAARRQPTASRDRRQAGGMHGAGPANVCRATTRRRSRLPFRSTAWRSAPGLGYDLSSTGIGSRKINTSGGQ